MFSSLVCKSNIFSLYTSVHAIITGISFNSKKKRQKTMKKAMSFVSRLTGLKPHFKYFAQSLGFYFTSYTHTSILLILQNSLNNLYFSTQCDYSLFMPKFLFGNCFQELLVINESHFYVDNPIYIIYHQNILRYRHPDVLHVC